MLTSRTEKWLSGEFQRERAAALEDSSGIPATEGEYSLADLGVGVEGQGINDPETYLLDSTPIDNISEPKGNAVDIRKLPGHD